MTVITEARRRIRWVLRHGLMRRMVERRRQAGEVTAKLMLDPAYVDDPFPHYAAVRSTGRAVHDGMLLHTTHHDVATAVLRSPDMGSAGMRTDDLPLLVKVLARVGGKSPLGPVEQPSMLVSNPPDHTRYRKLVTRAFSAKAVAGLRTRTEEIAAGLLDDMQARGGRADLIDDFAALLPATVIAEMLGAPVEMRRQFLDWGAAAGISLDAGLSWSEFSRSEKGTSALCDWMESHLDHLRAHPGDNILSALVHARAEEGKLTQDELVSIAVLLLAAGFETTVNLIGNAAHLLMAHPDQLALLREDPSRWPNAVDEVLRLDSPVQRTGRIARTDTDVAGVSLKAGQGIMVMLGGANRDPAVFPDPDRFDVLRENAGSHIAFSSGIHYCLGAGLAKMEAEVGLRALFGRFPDLAPAGAPTRRPTRVLRGYEHMPVTLETATVPA